MGDKATKAAVLYANVHHSELKEKYPLWQDRVKVISRIWRELNAEARKEFVNWARQYDLRVVNYTIRLIKRRL